MDNIYNPILLALLLFTVALLLFISWCRIFAKAGIPWERLFVPFFGTYWTYGVANAGGIFWCNLILSLISFMMPIFGVYMDEGMAIVLLIGYLIIHIIYCVKLSKAFGHGGGFAFGLIVLTPLFLMILGLGSSEYAYPKKTPPHIARAQALRAAKQTPSSRTAIVPPQAPEAPQVSAPASSQPQPEKKPTAEKAAPTVSWICYNCNTSNAMTSDCCIKCSILKKHPANTIVRSDPQ